MPGYDNHKGLEGTDKETWRRSEHILNLITHAQVKLLEGEALQNPWMITEGIFGMKQIIIPLLSEKIEEELDDGSGGKKIRKITLRGMETKKAQRYETVYSLARKLIQAYMSKNIHNGEECLDMAYKLLTELGQELLQDVEDFNLNFRKMENPAEAYKQK
jgi:hypothetical protein